MHVITICSRKGGVGKTTLSSHLAVEAVRAGAGRVAIADTDPQGGLAAWYNAREAQTPEFVDVSGGRPAIEACRNAGFDVLLIDTPPAISESISATIDLASLVLVPVRPSPNDLRAVGGTVSLVAAAKKPMVFIINQVTARARITAQAAIALSQHGTVAPVMIGSRVDFAASMTDGRTASELDPASKSGEEISELWQYIESRLQLQEAA
jgi:chromosome partitioning protein